MELGCGDPYFLLKNGLYQDFETLQADHTTDVLVLGGGISGALMAHALVKQGISCSTVDKRKIGLGSTSVSTSLLQYEIDVALHDLEKKIGKEKAGNAYHLCSDAIDTLHGIAQEIGFKEFNYCNSVYFAHGTGKSSFLRKEYESRKAAGFNVDFLGAEELSRRYGLRSGEAILSDKAATIDVYRFTHLLHRYNLSKGAKLFENTCVTEIEEHKDGVTLQTEKGYTIKAKKIVYATGYEVTEQISKSIVTLKSTFALVTEKIPNLPDFFEKHLFWNTADPYLYIREDQGRLIIGGGDGKNYDLATRFSLLDKKANELLKAFKKAFPDLDVKTQFTWCGTFGGTKDGLPYVGSYAKKPHSYFALGFGGNGITFSALAADMVAKSIKENVNHVPDMFRFNR